MMTRSFFLMQLFITYKYLLNTIYNFLQLKRCYFEKLINFNLIINNNGMYFEGRCLVYFDNIIDQEQQNLKLYLNRWLMQKVI